LAGYDTFIRNALDTITNRDSKRWYNPNYKFSRERLDDFKEIFKEMLGYHAKRLLKLVEKYEKINPDLKYWHPKDYNIKNPNFFREIDSEEKAYWYGFLYADAHLFHNRPRIHFELSVKDKDRIVQFMETIGLDGERIELRQRCMKYKGKIIPFKTARIRFSSKDIASDLENLGFTKFKSGEIGLPQFIRLKIIEAQKEVSITGKDWKVAKSGRIAAAFLLGFYDGDGTYMGGRQAKIYSTNKKLLDEVKSVFEIKNNVNSQSKTSPDISEDLSIEDTKSHKHLYYLTLGPEIFDAIMKSYNKSMKRKRFSEPE